jgi:molybdopterin synthase catalytic subunit
MKRFAVSDAPLSVDAVLAGVSDPAIGGIALFVGTVRDHNAGKPISLLEYQAYAAMAEKEMERIGGELEAEFPGVRVAAHHRTGALGVGDMAVVCAAGAPHRDQAFSACRALIDRIKERVPIWKREHGPDGPYWIGWENQNTPPR